MGTAHDSERHNSEAGKADAVDHVPVGGRFPPVCLQEPREIRTAHPMSPRTATSKTWNTTENIILCSGYGLPSEMWCTEKEMEHDTATKNKQKTMQHTFLLATFATSWSLDDTLHRFI